MSNDTRGTEPDSKDTEPDTTPESTESDQADADAATTPVTEDSDEFETRRSPALIATAVALPIALIVGLLVMGVLANRHHSRDPLALGAVPAPGASSKECSALMTALPDKIGDYTTSDLVAPAPAATHAWQLPDGGDPIVVRCGLDRPQEFNKASSTNQIQTAKAIGKDQGVNWFELRDPTSGVTSGTYWAVDRGTYIAVTTPDKAGATPLQDISAAIQQTIPQQAMDPNPLPN
ncbi:DUF3515 domain-containing protein [Nocardia sp. NPDC059240]|uniref:DUF3515 domain-containing protein n=1 Tax=Nocardia sp. NPDC059240 TaxID=3346786 RepID=UPI00368C4842